MSTLDPNAFSMHPCLNITACDCLADGISGCVVSNKVQIGQE